MNGHKCNLNITSNQLTFKEFHPGTFFGRLTVAKKIVLNDLSDETVQYDSNTGQKMIIYSHKITRGMLTSEFLSVLYFKLDEGGLDRYLALQKDIPVLGRTTTQSISCFF